MDDTLLIRKATPWISGDFYAELDGKRHVVDGQVLGHLGVCSYGYFWAVVHVPSAVQLYSFSGVEAARRFCEAAQGAADWSVALPPFGFGPLGSRLARLYLESRIPPDPIITKEGEVL